MPRNSPTSRTSSGRIYLASQSARRRRLIKQLNRPVTLVSSTFHERFFHNHTPSHNAMRNALGKVEHAVLPARARGVVLGADTFLYFRGDLIGKPRSMAHARRMIQSLRGKSHWVYTGLCLRDAATGMTRVSYAKSKVTFHHLSDDAIDAYHARVQPLDKAGAYAVQEDRGVLIKRVEGSLTNVIGLPMELLVEELAALDASVSRGCLMC